MRTTDVVTNKHTDRQRSDGGRETCSQTHSETVRQR